MNDADKRALARRGAAWLMSTASDDPAHVAWWEARRRLPWHERMGVALIEPADVVVSKAPKPEPADRDFTTGRGLCSHCGTEGRMARRCWKCRRGFHV